MRAPSSPPSNPGPRRLSRRTLLKAGLAGGAALLLARWLYAPRTPPAASAPVALDPGPRAMLAAIIPVILDGALPRGAEGAVARTETLAAVEQEIASLPPATRKELADLFSLLGFAPTRCLVAGVWSDWADATPESIASFLNRWRDSRFALLRSAYAALHRLVFGAWYSNPRAWAATGYAGPPSLDIG
jgi:hypothetical protein